MHSTRQVLFPHPLCLALLLAFGCDAGIAPTSDVAQGFEDAGQASSYKVSHPGTPAPDYTADELEALAASPEVSALNAPFVPTPVPRRSVYVPVSDGRRLALSLYFPDGFDEASMTAPIAYIEGWYPRPKEAEGEAVDLYRAAGFVVAIADPRGFGASFGAETGFLLERTRLDQQEMIAWLTAQRWSNRKVASVGFSISAVHAEGLAASGPPGLRAVVLREADFDNYTNNLFPGGVPNLAMADFVKFLLSWMRGDMCPNGDVSNCFITPVDEDANFDLLRAAFLEHQGNPSAAQFDELVYRDDLLGDGTVIQMSAAGHVAELQQVALPARVSASWLDGTTAESALRRFAVLPNVPMEVFIGAHTHSSGLHADPFDPTPFQRARPSAADQYGDDVAFVKRALAGAAIGRGIRYYVLGAGTWKNTPVWPPRGVKPSTLYLTRTGLSARGTGFQGERRYQVDPTTTSGTFTRWAAQAGAPVYYGDQRFAPGRWLTFDGEKVAGDMEIVGAPELCLVMSTDQTDGLVVAHLQDVAPDGRVTYLTEGELRLLHRKTSTGGCDPTPGTERTFARADAALVSPGNLMRIELPLLPTAALIRKGHHLRLALAGADAGPRRPFDFSRPGVDTFPLLSVAPATWSVRYGAARGSSLVVPMRPWRRGGAEGNF